MPWLDPLDWSYPAGLVGTQPPYLLWVADTTFALFWLVPDAIAGSAPCRQDFSVASGVIEPIGEPQVLTGVPTGVSSDGWVSKGQLGPDGGVMLEFAEVTGT